MANVPLNEAQAKLPELIHGLSSCDHLIITENDLPLARLTVATPRAFAYRLAVFNAIGLCATTAGVTFVDARLVNGVRFPGGRVYPLGYSVCWLSIALFFAVYWLVIRPRRKLLRLFLPPLAVLACTGLVLPNFTPFPHGA